MQLSKAQEEKAKVISELHDKFARAKGVIFADYTGLTADETFNLRKTLRAANLDYRVVKNTLAKRAAEGTSVGVYRDNFKGTLGIVFGYSDPVSAAKKVLEFGKKNNKLAIKGGVIEGKIFNPEEVKAVSELPSRDVLLSMLVGTMQSPLSKFASLLNATLSKFIYAMEAVKDKKASNEK